MELKAMKPLQKMRSIDPQFGLFPIKISLDSGGLADTQVTLGALGDSFYEYLLKVWLQGGRKEEWLREMYDKAMDGVMEKLLMTSSATGLAFLSDWDGRSNNRKMDHLVCFMPGLLALGAYTDPKGPTSKRAKRDLAVAKALMFTCREMYHRQATGLSPEYVVFPTHGVEKYFYSFLLFISSIRYFYSLLLFITPIHYFYSLLLFITTIHYFYSLILFIHILFIYYIHSYFIHYFHSLLPFRTSIHYFHSLLLFITSIHSYSIH